jgi:hypothetical protein
MSTLKLVDFDEHLLNVMEKWEKNGLPINK